MVSERSEKGSILYEEKKMSARVFLILVVLGLIGAFVLMMALQFALDSIFGLSLYFPLFLVFLLLIVLIPAAYARGHPLVIYEKGFDAPVSILKIHEAKERFIPFSDVKAIHPEETESFGTTIPRGFTIVTKEEKRINIFEFMEPRLREIRKKLMTALGDAWETVYVDAPYIGFDELQRIEPILSRSKMAAWGEALIVLAFGVALMFVSVFILFSFTMIIISMIVLMLGMFFGTFRVQGYYSAVTTYKKAVRADPTLKETFRSMGIDIVYEEPLKKAKRYTNADWKRLQARVRDKRPFILLVIGLGMIMGAMPTVFLDAYIDAPYYVFNIIAYSGLVISLSSLIFVWKASKASDFAKVLIEEELKQGTRILPEWFDVELVFFGPTILRSPPVLSEKEWEKLVAVSKERDEKRRGLFIVGAMTGLFLPMILLLIFDAPFFTIMILLLVGGSVIIAHSFSSIRPMRMLLAIEAYEDHSGQEIIPERYRDRIVRGYK